VADLLFIATLVAFFVLMVAFVRLCERIVGKEEATGSDSPSDVGDSADTSKGPTKTTAATAVDNTTPEEVPA
jgi:hypothetical protein